MEQIIYEKIYAFISAFVIAFSLSTTVWASSSDAPIEAQELAAATGNEIIELAEGVYAVGNELFIDVTVCQPESVDVDSCDVATLSPNGDDSITPYGAALPSNNSIWDWADGSYKGYFEMEERVFTNYRFVGYSSYRVTASISDSGHTVTGGAFSVSAWVGSTKDDTYNGTNGYKVCTFTGFDAGDKVAFSVNKANDGFTVSGSITVAHT